MTILKSIFWDLYKRNSHMAIVKIKFLNFRDVEIKINGYGFITKINEAFRFIQYLEKIRKNYNIICNFKSEGKELIYEFVSKKATII